MNQKSLKVDAILLLAACIWGFAFVAQRAGMAYVGPFTFNGVRFALGSLSLLPLFMARERWKGIMNDSKEPRTGYRTTMAGAILAGVILFFGASLQQVGLVYTTAGKAGFITGLYVVIVPFLGLFLGHRSKLATWLAAILAAAGLWLLSVTEELTISRGDLLEIGGAFFWACHVILVGWLSPRMASIRLAIWQFSICALLSLMVATFAESLSFGALLQAAIPILYGGLLSVGVAYTLQIVGQKHAQPAHAAILLSLEAAFAALGGWVVLSETLTLRALIGCALMFSAMVLSQILSEAVPSLEKK